MDTPKYKRVLVKISGEALAGDKHFGLNFDVIGPVCDVIKRCQDIGCEIGIVVGGGNFWRGVKDGGGRMERTRADHMGMLATTINALALADALEQRGCEVRVQTAIAMDQIAEPYIRNKATRHLSKGRVVIFGCGTGNPYFSTDTAAALRAAEIGAEVILLAKNIDGVYNSGMAGLMGNDRETALGPDVPGRSLYRCGGMDVVSSPEDGSRSCPDHKRALPWWG